MSWGTIPDWAIVLILVVMVWQGATMSENRILREILRDVKEMLQFLRRLFPPTRMEITQLGGCMAITGVQVGGQGTFQETPQPSGSVFPSGTVISWASSDPLVTLSVSADGSQAVASVDPSDTNTSFQLSTSAVVPGLSSPVLGGPVSVPILPVVPPVPTSMSIDQIA